MICARFYHSGVDNMNSASTNNVVPWDSEDYKLSGITHSTVTNNSRITVEATGKYLFTGGVALSSAATGTIRYGGRLKFRVNGSTTNNARFQPGYIRGDSGHSETNLVFSLALNLTAADYVEILIDREANYTSTITMIANESTVSVIFLSGAEGPAGLDGPTGPSGGPTGPMGATGPSGGPTGASGATGTPGLAAVSMLRAQGNTGGVSFANVENNIVWAAADITSADLTLSGADITIDTTGTYKFTVTLRTDNGNRTELFIRTYIDVGSGYVEDANRTVSDYVSRDTDQNTGAVTFIDMIELTATDQVQFRGFGDTDGTSTALNAGTILLIERLA